MKDEVLDGRRTGVSSKFICDELGCEELRDAENFRTGDTHEERDGVENVPKDKLKCQCVDPETTTYPSQEPVNRSDERQDGQHVCSLENRQS